MTTASTTTAHPLDPLGAGEIAQAVAIVRSAPQFADFVRGARFITVELRAPAKRDVLAHAAARERGDDAAPLPREADVVVLDRHDASTHEIVVALDPPRIAAWTRRTDVQPLAVVEELAEAEELVKHDPEFRARLAERGIGPADGVQIDAWPAGNFGDPDERGLRLARCVAFAQPAPGDSEWAHPVDGLIALVDLTSLTILRIEDHGVVPVPPEPGNFDAAAAAPLRTDIRPYEITQPDGPSFSVDGNVVRWQRWELHVGFTPREGLVLGQVGYRRRRPRCARSSTAPRCRRWSSPTATRTRPTTSRPRSTSGENGVGIAGQRRSTLGCDCLGEIHYFDAAVASGDGEVVTIPNAICLHEEDSGVLWRHIDWRTGAGGVRRGPAAGDLLVLGDRQLRLRLLLVPPPGRHDRSTR